MYFRRPCFESSKPLLTAPISISSGQNVNNRVIHMMNIYFVLRNFFFLLNVAWQRWHSYIECHAMHDCNETNTDNISKAVRLYTEKLIFDRTNTAIYLTSVGFWSGKRFSSNKLNSLLGVSSRRLATHFSNIERFSETRDSLLYEHSRLEHSNRFN